MIDRRPQPRHPFTQLLASMAVPLLFAGCYSLAWSHAPNDQLVAQPAAIAALFAARPDGKYWFDLETPGKGYGFDPGEKDASFDHPSGALLLRKAGIELHARTPPGRVVADLTLLDGAGGSVRIPAVDLLRLLPRIDTTGEMQYPELLLEEYNRHGVAFRREHGEFAIDVQNPALQDAADRSYRAVLANNCLDPQKLEVALTTADFSDFGERLASPLNLNQDRILAHSWFYLDRPLYQALLRVKNPHLTADPELAYDYDQLTARAEQVTIDWDALRTLSGPQTVEVLEVGARSGRRLEPVDVEQHYKWSQGIFVNRDEFKTYADVPVKPVRLAEFSDRGFYYPDKPKVFDYGWVRGLDQVRLSGITHPHCGTLVEMTLEGEGSPYAFRLGNLDLALLDEQSLSFLSFGFNMYPTGRRHTPRQATLNFDQDLMPEDQKPYLLMYERASGRFINHQLKGFDRVYLGWDSIDRSVLNLYLVSYERIMPVWMAKVRFNDELVDRARVRRFIYGG